MKKLIKSEDICEMIRYYPLEFPKTSDDVEDLDIPSLVIPFKELIAKYNRVPSQEEYYNKYCEINENHFNEKKYDEYTLEFIKARIYKAYPSLVRDFHFKSFFDENFRKLKTTCKIIRYRVRHDDILDMKNGIDLNIEFNYIHFGIELFIKSIKSDYWRRRKLARTKRLKRVKYIEVPLIEKEAIMCGEFFLYGKPHFDFLIKKMNEIYKFL